MYKKKQGVTIIEVVVGAAIILIAVLSLLSVHVLYVRTETGNIDILKAGLLAEEGMEAMRMMRDVTYSGNIASLTNGTPYAITWNGTTWGTSATVSPIDTKYYRTVVVSAVNRDSSDDIVTSGGITDVNTKKVTVSVAWLDRTGTSTKSLSTYLSNFYSN